MTEANKPLVLIEWVDSAQPTHGWSWLEDHPWTGVVKCQSVGWLVHEDEEVKALAPNLGNMGGDIQVSAVIRIPTQAVIRQVELSTAV